MDYIKKNIGMTIVAIIGIVLSIGCIVVIVKTHSEASTFQQQVIEIKDQLEKFQRTQFALTPGNVEVANANSALAGEKYLAFMGELAKKRAKDDLGNFSQLGAKNHLTKICTKMENQLRSSDITLSASLEAFSFGEWMGQDVLPAEDEIPMILRNLEIAQELVYLLSQAQLESVDEFSRQTALDPVQRDLYDYISFGLKLSGSLESIRGFLNSLNEASYFFIVRSVNITTGESTLGGARAAAAPVEEPGRFRGAAPAEFEDASTGAPVAPKYLPKRDRVLFKALRNVKAEIAVDYVEFHVKE